MIDKSEIASRFRKSIKSYDENALVQKLIAEHLIGLCRNYCPVVPANLLEIGCGTGLLTEKICREWPETEIYINDLVGEMCDKTAEKCCLPDSRCLKGDIETLKCEKSFGMIISASTFQWLTHPAHAFARFAKGLNAPGWFVFSTFGPDNYKELKTITERGLVYPSTEELIRLLSTYFTILSCEEEHHVLYFSEPVEILRHIKNTGVNALSDSRVWTPKRLCEFAEQYTARFLINGRYPLTYHPVYFICRKKL